MRKVGSFFVNLSFKCFGKLSIASLTETGTRESTAALDLTVGEASSQGHGHVVFNRSARRAPNEALPCLPLMGEDLVQRKVLRNLQWQDKSQVFR